MYGEERWGVPGYTEVRELGSGASGRVVLATRDHDGAEVAIKYLSERLRADVGFVARFRQEARLLGAMRSRHHARLIDYVESGRGSAIVMELVNGVSLRELLRSEGPTGAEAALTVLKGSLQGLAEAHDMGIVHRDYKPENVIVQGDGASRLVDFGIAVTAGTGSEAAGTPPYMAPEQWSGAPASAATDVYAATVVFFECLTGARPYRATNLAALAHQHQVTPPPVEEVPPALQGLVEQGLAKDPADRPESAEAFLIELEVAAREAYGADWEERGRRRLTSLVGLLPLLWPVPPEPAVGPQTTLAETSFDSPARLLGKVSAKISTKAAVTTACVGVAIAVAVVVVNPWRGDPELRAQTTTTSPTPAVATAEPVEPDTLEPVATATPEEPATEEPTTEPTRSAAPVTQPASQPTAQPTRRPTARPTTRPTVRPSRTRTPTPRPTRTRTPVPAETPVTRLSGKVSTGDPATTPPRQPSATPTRDTPTVRPTRQPTREPSTPPTSPRPSDTPTDDETPRNPPTPTVIID